MKAKRTSEWSIQLTDDEKAKVKRLCQAAYQSRTLDPMNKLTAGNLLELFSYLEIQEDEATV